MLIDQSSTPTITFLLVDETDDETAETGLTPTVQISKNGGAFATVTNSVTEIANGWYKVTLTSTETNTVGPLIIRATATGANEWRDLAQVVDYDSFKLAAGTAMGLTSGAITTSTFASGAINAAAIAADAIGASELASDAVAEIADAIWDEALAGHTTAGSAGKQLADNAPNLTADAVWDEDITGHVGANSAGAELQAKADTGDQMTLQDGAITAAKFAANAIAAAAIASGAITSAKFAAGAIDANAIATDAITAAKIAAGAIGTSEFATALIDAIVDAVWDELLSGHATAGSAGEALTNAGSGATAGDIADAVWDEALAGHAAAGSAGEKLAATAETGDFPTEAAFVADIADGVWDEALAGHATAGSAGETLASAGAADANSIADAVWDEALGSHTGTGSAGEKLGQLDTAAVTNLVGKTFGGRLVGAIGATFRHTFTGLSIDSGWTRCALGIKRDLSNVDEDADVYILVTNGGDAGDGLIYIVGQEADSGQQVLASLTVNQAGGEVDVWIDEEMTELLATRETVMGYALKFEWGSGDTDESVDVAGEIVWQRFAIGEAIT